ncbi:MAG TPA: RNase adapter RapZ [Pyrinomonadaceae bacterium]|nr:RNase adapter RapZ [Pyrinomonadaceae bacterium]
MSRKKRAANPSTNEAPDIVVITGLSGSGMSSATNAFEDLGYFCVDNLPLTLLPTFARLVQPDEVEDEDGDARIKRAALVINIREGHFLSEFESQLKKLRRASGLSVYVLFFEASDEVLQRRFSETRRPHPADTGDGLLASIRAERDALAHIRGHADHIIDTSEHNVHTLRRYLIERFSPDRAGTPMRVQVLSFGHKYGSPRDLDLLFDVRHLPNPYFVETLRAYSGNHRLVAAFLRKQPETNETLERFGSLLDYLLPLYRREGKSYVTVGIGCTGGRHRSVMVANALARRLRRDGFDAMAVHRDVAKTRTRRAAKGRTAAKGKGARRAASG